MKGKLGRELSKLREGEVTFAEFSRTTAATWRSIALYLMRRWVSPAAVAQGDVEQELLLAAWKYLNTWDPKRGVALERYIVWNACNDAKRWLHHQRGAKLHGTIDKEPSRYPICFAALGGRTDGDEDPGERALARIAVDAAQDEYVDARRQQRAIIRQTSRTVEEAIASAALLLAEGDCHRGAKLLMGSADARRMAKIVSEAHAVRVVRRARARVTGFGPAFAGQEGGV